MLKLKLQYFGHLMRSWQRPWCWKTLKGEEEGDRRWNGWMASPIQWIWTWANSGRWGGTGRLDLLQSMGSQRVGHDRETNIWASLVAQTERNPPAMWETWIRSLGREDPPWRRKWQPTPVSLPGKSYGQRSLAVYSPWGCKELDMTEQLHYHYHYRVKICLL